MKKLFILLCVFSCLFPLRAQLFCSFTHYSTEDGLSQNTVMNILQDRRGNMWFTTWDGLNKFDGYTFKVYKAKPDNHVELVNNRVDYMYDDPYGCLWLQAYDDRVFRFNPKTEVFERVPQANDEGRSQQIASIRVLPGGTVWLLAKHEGAIRVRTDAETLALSSTWYSTATGLISATLVYDVFEDTDGNEWLLTDNGLVQIVPGQEDKPVPFFVDRPGVEDMGAQPFYVAYEWKDRIYSAFRRLCCCRPRQRSCFDCRTNRRSRRRDSRHPRRSCQPYPCLLRYRLRCRRRQAQAFRRSPLWQPCQNLPRARRQRY